MKKTVTEEKTYCDTEGCKKEAFGHCWNCGADVCSEHSQLVDCSHIIYTYVCPNCRSLLVKDIQDLFNKFRNHKPAQFS